MDPEGRELLAGEDYDSSDAESSVGLAPQRPPVRSIVATAALLGATAVLALLSRSSGGLAASQLLGRNSGSTLRRARVGGDSHLTVLEEAAGEDPCEDLPFLRIMSIKSNNLGGKGPDKDAPEGLIYLAKSFNAGLDGKDVEIHLHAVNEYFFDHEADEGLNLSAGYTPEWPKVNGITGHFGTINIHPGTNVTCKLYGFDPASGQRIKLPRWAMTFFDLDTGKDGYRSVEFLKMHNFKHYYMTNTSELIVRQMGGGATKFTGTREGNGDDNPENPLELTVSQKNRAVSFEFENTDVVKFQLGASAGDTARVFQFVVRPVLRCSYTKLSDGRLIAHDSGLSPFSIVKSGGEHSKPVAALVLGFAMMALQRWL